MKRLILFTLLLLLTVSSVNAITMTGWVDLNGIGQAIPPSSYIGDRTNIFYVADDCNITIFNTIGGSESTGQITGFPTDVADVWGESDNIYVVLADGRVYMIENSIGSRSFSSLSLTAPSFADGVYIGDLSAGTTAAYLHIVSDSNSIYVFDNAPNKIYQIPKSTLTSIEFATSLNLANMYPGSDYLLVSDRNTTAFNLWGYSAANTRSRQWFYAQSTVAWSSIAELDNGHYILSAVTDSTTDTYAITERYANGTSAGTIVSKTITGFSAAAPYEIYVPQNGIIVSLESTQINTYASVSGSGGYVLPDADPSDDGDDGTTTGEAQVWTNDEIDTSLRSIVPPIFFIVLLFFFLAVIGGR